MNHQLIMTNAGLQAAFDANNNGIDFNIKYLGVGDQNYTPNPEQQHLVNERARVQFNQFKKVSDTAFSIVAVVSGDEEYFVNEMGIYNDKEVLIGVMSNADKPITYKPAGGQLVQPLTLDFNMLPPNSINIVTGVNNLNILVDDQLAALATASINTMTRQVQQLFRLSKLESMLNQTGA